LGGDIEAFWWERDGAGRGHLELVSFQGGRKRRVAVEGWHGDAAAQDCKDTQKPDDIGR
jgi:hypothetical protein